MLVVCGSHLRISCRDTKLDEAKKLKAFHTAYFFQRFSTVPVVGLSEVAEYASIAGCHDDATELLFLEGIPCGLSGFERALEVHCLDKVPVLRNMNKT